MSTDFFINSALIGAGLAMDAFSASLADGLSEPRMKKGKMISIALCFSFFQWLMPLLGWLCVHTAASLFKVIEPYIPWVALLLLFIIGAKSIAEGVKNNDNGCTLTKISISAILLQGVATSIDALSVGFTIPDYTFGQAMGAPLIIAAVTFTICLPGVAIGKRFGTGLACKASIVGGVILIAIGLKICIESFF